jgi:maltose/moltooligosaccharide transporter
MAGIGIAWASILSLPYAIIADSVPASAMGLYMGIFNFFIVIPQLVAASVLGFILKTAFRCMPMMADVFHTPPMFALAIGGASFFASGLLVLRLPKNQLPQER